MCADVALVFRRICIIARLKLLHCRFDAVEGGEGLRIQRAQRGVGGGRGIAASKQLRIPARQSQGGAQFVKVYLIGAGCRPLLPRS